MVKRDVNDCIKIAAGRSEEPWTARNFLDAMIAKNSVALVAEEVRNDGKIVIAGFIYYLIFGNRLEIVNAGVDKRFDGLGVSSALLDKVKVRATSRRKTRIVVHVCERFLDVQLFLRSQGFKAVKVIRRFFGEDAAYRFAWEKTK